MRLRTLGSQIHFIISNHNLTMTKLTWISLNMKETMSQLISQQIDYQWSVKMYLSQRGQHGTDRQKLPTGK